MKRILVVDDNSMDRSILQYYLSKSNLRPVLVDCPLLALEEVKHNHYDAIFIDVQMPKLNGFELHARIRKICERKNVKIFFMSGEAASPINVLRAVSNGAEHFFVKPIRFDVLSERLRLLRVGELVDKWKL